MCTNERARVCEHVRVLLCCGGVLGYTHTDIFFDLGDLGWVVCCSARDEARTHIHKDKFVLVEN